VGNKVVVLKIGSSIADEINDAVLLRQMNLSFFSFIG